MAAQAAERRREQERQERARAAVIAEYAAERQELADIPNRNERAEQARELRAQQEATAACFAAEAAKELEHLTGLLRSAAAERARNLAAFRRAVPDEPAPTVEDIAAPPRPTWSQYAPPPAGLFGRRRYERAVVAARADLDAALARYDQTLASALAGLTRQHERRAAERRRAHEAEWDAVATGVAAGDEDAVDTLVAASLHASTALRGFIESGRTTYDGAARELVLEIDIPDTDVVPRERAWRYVSARTSIASTPAKPGEVAATYVGFVGQVVLAAVDVCFRSIGADTVDVVSVNGHVQTIDPATGQPDHPCLVTVTTDRVTFGQLDLGHPRLDPKACPRKLGAEISPHPHNLEHIEPIVNFELAKYRIAYGPEALAKLDHRIDLLQMNPYELERLVRDLFAKMGYDTWRTESSRDDGIDAVATKSDPHMPVECIVQAKRYRGAVAPKEVQALMGAMAEKPTATHGYLVTTSWLSPRSRQRARSLRIHTIERNQLAALVKDLLGIDIVISNEPPAYREGGARPRRQRRPADK
jgi:restriction system protein